MQNNHNLFGHSNKFLRIFSCSLLTALVVLFSSCKELIEVEVTALEKMLDKSLYTSFAVPYTTNVDAVHINVGLMFRAIAYGDDKFLAINTKGQVAVSTDGINWTFEEEGAFLLPHAYDVAYGNGKFVAVGGDANSRGKIYVCDSDDTKTWTSGDITPRTGTQKDRIKYSSITFYTDITGKSAFVVTGGSSTDSEKLYAASDPWTPVGDWRVWPNFENPYEKEALLGTVFGFDRIVAFGKNGLGRVIMQGVDDRTADRPWSSIDTPVNYAVSDVVGGAYQDTSTKKTTQGVFLAVSSAGNVISSDISAVSWKTPTTKKLWENIDPNTGVIAGRRPLCMSYGNGIFVIGGQAGNVAISTDQGKTWKSKVMFPGKVDINRIIFVKNRFYFVGGTMQSVSGRIQNFIGISPEV
ncbi:MAG: hypothetical protein Ta2A_03940 [Treponemataceae bacterium]|nr:MAG: hypothetical protein Ta2A_03940 [Treponemataceae bacterium]